MLDKAVKIGASYTDARYDYHDSELITVENKALKGYSSSSLSGIGIRVIIRGSLGYASTSDITQSSLEKTLQAAVGRA